MAEPHIFKQDVSETVYELVDPSEVDAVLQKGLLPTHCVFIDADGEYQAQTGSELLAEKSETKGYLWQYDETIALLNLIEQHYDSIQRSRKRQVIWKNISQELQSQHCAVDAQTCHRKWRNLIRTYNIIQQNGGSGKIIKFQFYNEMQNILSKRGCDKNQGHIEAGQIDLHNYAAKFTEKDEKSTLKNQTKKKEEEAFQPGPSSTENSIEPETDVVITYVEKKSRATQTTPCITSTKARGRVRKRKKTLLGCVTLHQRRLQGDRLLLRQQVEERRDENNAKEKRFQEKMSLKREQLELEKKKVELFEKYLNLKLNGKVN